MKQIVKIKFVILLFLSTYALAGIHNVPSEYPTIQAAINASVDGDNILVTPGIYSGDGNRDIDLKGKTITVKSIDPNDPNIVSATIIDCQGSEQDPHRGFYLQNAEGPDSVIAGLTITNGCADYGGGICGERSSVTITSCIISNNAADYGGGLLVRNGAITNCTIVSNSANYGGGLSNCHGAITNCTIVNNSAKSGGGLFGCGGVINSCIIADNSSEKGGGLYLCDGAITSCVIFGNSADNGGGLHLCDGNIINCTIVNNLAYNRGGGLYLANGTITNCIIWNNMPDQILDSTIPTYSCIRGYGNINNNIDAEPYFINPEEGNYHLSFHSPCISAGDPNYILDEEQTDIDGQLRLIGKYIDIGADEFFTEGALLGILPREIRIVAREGDSNMLTQYLTIWNDGSGVVNWTIDEDCDWLNIDPIIGSSSGQTDEVVLNIDVTGLSRGQYSCELTISAPNAINSITKVPVIMNIREILNHLHVPSEFPTIQEGIDAALDGETIIVAPGIYTGEGNRDIDFKGKTITVKSEGGSDTCIIDCQGSKEEQHRGFYFHYGEDTNSVVQGFTITDGYMVQYPLNYGGGIYCKDSNPHIENCVLTANRALFGGGIACVDSNAVITNCIVRNNIASINPPYWTGNDYGSGGGLSVNGQPVIINCIISGNGSSSDGGGISCGGNPAFINCTIYGNRNVHGIGGGISIGGRSGNKVTLKNCIVWGNSAGVTCNQISNPLGGIVGSALLELTYCTVQDLDIESHCLMSYVGNWSLDDPCFADPGYWDSNGTQYIDNDFWVEGDYHLKSQAGRFDPNSRGWVIDDVTSPCIDAGDPNSTVGEEPEPNNGRINMGAYGGTIEASKSYSEEPSTETIVMGDKR